MSLIFWTQCSSNIGMRRTSVRCVDIAQNNFCAHSLCCNDINIL